MICAAVALSSVAQLQLKGVDIGKQIVGIVAGVAANLMVSVSSFFPRYFRGRGVFFPHERLPPAWHRGRPERNRLGRFGVATDELVARDGATGLETNASRWMFEAPPSFSGDLLCI